MHIPTQEQLQQKEIIKEAKMNGFDTMMLEQHMDWHPHFMAFYHYLQKEGKESIANQLADILSSYKSTEDEKYGYIGINAGIVYSLYEILNNDLYDKFQMPIRNGYIDEDALEYEVVQLKTEYVDKKSRLITGRFPLAENLIDIQIQMAEGEKEIFDILDTITSAAVKIFESKDYMNDALDQIRHNSSSMLNVFLSLDDMNIRGYQIKYAYDFCEGDAELLLNKIKNRDKELVAYVNHRTAQSILDKERQTGAIAREHGASFTNATYLSPVFGEKYSKGNWIMTIIDADDYILENPQTLSLNLNNMGIYDSTPLNLGLEILEHRGFRIFFEKDTQDDKKSILMCSPKNMDVVHIIGAKKNNINYAGIDIIAFRNGENSIHCTSSPLTYNDDFIGRKYEISGDGMLKDYSRIVNMTPIALSKIDFSHYPLPRYLSYYDIYNNFNKVLEKAPRLVGYLSDTLASYNIVQNINHIIASFDKNSFNTKVCPIYEQLETNRYHMLTNILSPISLYDVHSNFILFRLAAAYLHLPDEHIEKYYNAFLEDMQNMDYIKKHPEILQEIKAQKDVFLHGIEEEKEIHNLVKYPIEKIGVDLPWLKEHEKEYE